MDLAEKAAYEHRFALQGARSANDRNVFFQPVYVLVSNNSCNIGETKLADNRRNSCNTAAHTNDRLMERLQATRESDLLVFLPFFDVIAAFTYPLLAVSNLFIKTKSWK